MLSGGDRRSIAKSNRVHTLLQKDPTLVSDLAALASDALAVMRGLHSFERSGMKALVTRARHIRARLSEPTRRVDA